MAIIEDRNGKSVNFADLTAGDIFQFAYADHMITAMRMVPTGQYQFQFADLENGQPYAMVPTPQVMLFPNAVVKTMKNSSIVANIKKPLTNRTHLAQLSAPAVSASSPPPTTVAAIFRHIDRNDRIRTCLKLNHSSSAALDLETGEMLSILPETDVDHLPNVWIQLSPPPY